MTRPPRLTPTLILLGLLTLWAATAASGSAAELFDWQQASELHPGVLWGHLETDSPRNLMMSVLRVDTHAPGLRFYSTPRMDDWVANSSEAQKQTTRDFLRQSHAEGRPLLAAVNANVWTPFPAPDDTPANLHGLAISEGVVVSPPGSVSLLVRDSGELSIAFTTAQTDVSGVHTAVSGFGFALFNGTVLGSNVGLHPRTGLGLSSDSQYLFLLAIDGRRWSSQGVTVNELGQWLQYFGAYNGIEMDGGGSTTMAWWDPAVGDAQLLNVPNSVDLVNPADPLGSMQAEALYFQNGMLPNERAVGNNFGFYFVTVPEPSTLVLAGLGALGLFVVRKRRRAVGVATLLVALALSAANARAVTIPTVPVGNAGDAPDPLTGNLYGSVSYDYRIGTYEVTNAQYAEFLNFKAASDPLGLYNTNMGSDARGGITRSGDSGSFTYTTKTNMADKPVNYVSWYDAIRFANWLHNGQGIGDTETGAYTLGQLGAGGIPVNGNSITRNAEATWWILSEDEWYKAAYHQPAAQGGDTDNYWLYPTASNGLPTMATANSVGDISNPGANVANFNFGADWNGMDGNVTTVGSAGPLSESYYGTSDQGGNVYEWNEALISGFSLFRGLRGGSWLDSFDLATSGWISLDPTNENSWFGFRVATVPEPSTFALAALGALGLIVIRKRGHHRATCAAMLFASLTLLAADARAETPQTFYRLTDLGTLGGTQSFATDINASGQIVGYSTLPFDSTTHAFLYSGGTMIDLGTLGGISSNAYGINESGQVVGQSLLSDNTTTRAFLYDNGTMTDLGTLGGAHSRAFDINDLGQIVGSASLSDASTRAVLYSDGAMTDLGTLGGNSSVALAISNGGHIVGHSTPAVGSSQAFLYSGGVMTGLGSLDSNLSIALDVSASGHAVGWTGFFGAEHAFQSSGGVMTDLVAATNASAHGINASGQIVGSYFDSVANASRAFLYADGQVTVLNGITMLPPGWSFGEIANIFAFPRGNAGPQVINDSGVIAGTARNPDGQTRAVTLTPVSGITTTLVIDAAQSHLTLEADIAGELPFYEQLPGSLTSALFGSIQADLVGPSGAWTDIRFRATHDILLVGHAGPFQPGDAPADLAAFVDLGGIQASGVFRGSVFSGSSHFTPIDEDGNFSVDGLLTTTTSSLDYFIPGIAFGSSPVNASGLLSGVGKIEQVGSTLYVTIPIDFSNTIEVEELGGLPVNYHFTGQIVGTVQLTPVPEPSTLVLAGIGALGLFVVRHRRRAVRALLLLIALALFAPPAFAQDSLPGSSLVFKSSGGSTLFSPGYVGTYLTVPTGGSTINFTLNATEGVFDSSGAAPHMNIVIADTKFGFTVDNPVFTDYTTGNVTLPGGTYFVRVERDYVAPSAASQNSVTVNNLSVATLSGSTATFANSNSDALAISAANTYIENFRQGTASVSLIGARPGKTATVTMTRNDFNFGTAVAGINSLLGNAYLNPGNNSANAELYRQHLLENFNAIVPENAGKWVYQEPNGQLSDSSLGYLNDVFDFARVNDLNLRMHTLLLWGQQQPQWVQDLIDSGNTTALAAAIENRIKYYVGDPTDGNINNDPALNYFALDVINEHVHGGAYLNLFGPSGVADIYNQVAAAAQSVGAHVQLFTNEFGALAEWAGPYGNWYRDSIESIRNAGGAVSGIGVQNYTGINDHSPTTIMRSLQNLSVEGLPITLTEFGVGSTSIAMAPNILEDNVRLAFGNAAVDGFFMWGFWQGAMWDGAPAAALYNTNWTLTPSGEKWQQLMSEWTTPTQQLEVGADGKINVNGFYGDYEITLDNGREYALSLVKGTTDYQLTPRFRAAIDPSHSSLSLAADLDGTIAIEEQAAGSLITALAGSFKIELARSNGKLNEIRFIPSHEINLVDQPGSVPPGGLSGDLTGVADLGFPVALALRDSLLALSSASLPIDADGNFSLDDVLAQLSSALHFDLAGALAGSTSASGMVQLNGLGHVEQVGNTVYITIPFDFTLSKEALALMVTYHYSGQIVATTLVPEPSTVALAALGAVGLLAFRKRRRGRKT